MSETPAESGATTPARVRRLSATRHSQQDTPARSGEISPAGGGHHSLHLSVDSEGSGTMMPQSRSFQMVMGAAEVILGEVELQDLEGLIVWCRGAASLQPDATTTPLQRCEVGPHFPFQFNSVELNSS